MSLLLLNVTLQGGGGWGGAGGDLISVAYCLFFHKYLEESLNEFHQTLQTHSYIPDKYL